MNDNQLITIATIKTPFKQKFGIPRQSGLVSTIKAEIRFTGEFRSPEAIRGIEEFSHLWLLWGFSKAKRNNISLTVAPPRLGGNERKGVFATRSPFRPNSIGLSSVKLEKVKYLENGEPVLIVLGADILDGSPIYDIKPYLPYTDIHADAVGGFADEFKDKTIKVVIPEKLKLKLPVKLQKTIIDVLAQDPRAAYNKNDGYIYGMSFESYDIRFKVVQNILYVTDIVHANSENIK
ncbi:MAG: tRNA (N6-threonylcarbamoyladenosine(37)-N6)-methyltransferase TrmO [Ruminococcus sp.]|nr:tRNA (N6-threonylcarbamoyladenosine(37)-N6)-methyltransferase TrmO [Ruminococcus sp.]